MGYHGLGACAPRLTSTMRADRGVLGQGVGAFSPSFIPICLDSSGLFPTIQSTRLPSTAVVCGRPKTCNIRASLKH